MAGLPRIYRSNVQPDLQADICFSIRRVGKRLTSGRRRAGKSLPGVNCHPPPVPVNSPSITILLQQPPAPLRPGRRDRFRRTIHSRLRPAPSDASGHGRCFPFRPDCESLAVERFRLTPIQDFAKHQLQRLATGIRAGPPGAATHPDSG